MVRGLRPVMAGARRVWEEDVVPLQSIAPLLALVLALGSTLGFSRAGVAQEAKFTPEFLKSPAAIEMGRKVWQERCTFCHGRDAYPGKAPRLNPSKYTPEFVYDRVTNGFKGMPPWKDYNEEQRKAVAAYVVSPEFTSQ
jgi:mono/diheme cytochrome c family protein